MFNRLGDSFANWQQFLTEIKKARSTFDTSDTQKSFGVCVIDYEQVQARVAEGYIESVWSQVGECDEGDACLDFEGPE